ncbi:DUF3900 domain-containing protein [Paenibacillus turpanensis]|uniref:DUF3900 domain-containing protein n=1 Tax=Paenibacillus turpanensis TaxID=2689078 RepID=UPI00140833DE|nr:DUF3900 domain-containing protein [Paenibacillus turpanensis]
MHFSIQYLSFYVIHADKTYKHYQTMDGESYQDSELKSFLDEEFVRICKRKVEKHPNTEQAPTKIGRFIVEPGHELSSNPNYNLFQRLRTAASFNDYQTWSHDLLLAYAETSSVRSGALIVARAKVDKWFDEPFLFVLKCDFEPKIARIADENSLIAAVDMAISARSIKSIQYPHMPEEGMLEESELKIHQASHARYFEDFLKFVTYEKSLPEMMNEQMVTRVQQYIEEKWQDDRSEAREREEQHLELWAASEKRDLQPTWTHEQVLDAAVAVTEHKPDLELKFKLGDVFVKAKLSDYGVNVHFAQVDGKYVVLLEGDSFLFTQGISPVELLHPAHLDDVVDYLKAKREEETRQMNSGSSLPPYAIDPSGE